LKRAQNEFQTCWLKYVPLRVQLCRETLWFKQS
jgi:hypothetical protein